jgi:hypothetical protein
MQYLTFQELNTIKAKYPDDGIPKGSKNSLVNCIGLLYANG